MLNTKIMFTKILGLFATSAWKTSNAYQSRISDNYVRYVKIGSIVIASGRFKAEVAVTAGTPIATGFYYPAGSAAAPLAGSTSDAVSGVSFAISQYGSLTPLTTLTVGTYYSVGGVYITWE